MSTHAQLQELDHAAETAQVAVAELLAALMAAEEAPLSAMPLVDCAQADLRLARASLGRMRCDRIPCDRIDGNCQRCAPVPL